MLIKQLRCAMESRLSCQSYGADGFPTVGRMAKLVIKHAPHAPHRV